MNFLITYPFTGPALGMLTGAAPLATSDTVRLFTP